MKKKATFLSLVFIVGILAAGYVMFMAGKEIYRERKIQQEVEKLKAEARKIKSDNENLREKITYLDTDQFRERIAKEKLNLKKDGERVIEVRPSTVLGEESMETNQDEDHLIVHKENIENYKKWWRQFFSY